MGSIIRHATVSQPNWVKLAERLSRRVQRSTPKSVVIRTAKTLHHGEAGVVQVELTDGSGAPLIGKQPMQIRPDRPGGQVTRTCWILLCGEWRSEPSFTPALNNTEGDWKLGELFTWPAG